MCVKIYRIIILKIVVTMNIVKHKYDSENESSLSPNYIEFEFKFSLNFMFLYYMRLQNCW